MLIINSASAGNVRYWERSAVWSTWLGRGAPLLGLSGAVDIAELRAVMLGLGPGGVPLTSRPALRQRHGWDLVFAAPKSVSLLAEASLERNSELLRSAFRTAVDDALATLEDRAAWLRSGGELVPARGVVAASFEHLASDAGQPHLHAHLVLANIGAKAEQGWGCLVGNELWRWREALGAGFQLALRSRLGEAGFGFRWELTSGGLGEIVSVPSQARSAASSRSLGVRAGALAFGSPSSASERAAQGKTRQVKATVVPGAGWGQEQAAEVLREALGSPALPPPPPSNEAVARALLARGSVFGEPDVVVAVAETSSAGYNLREAADWSRRWCQQGNALGVRPIGQRDRSGQPGQSVTGQSVALAGGATKRWTTALATETDRRVLDIASEPRSGQMARVSPQLAERELEDLGTAPQLVAAALSVACDGAGVVALPRAPWLAQAAVIDAARAAWQAAGVTVRVACPSELSARRWRALTSLQRAGAYGAGAYGSGAYGYGGYGSGAYGAGGYGAGEYGAGEYGAGGYGPGAEFLGGGGPGRRVIVVDAADRLSPTSLVSLLDNARSTQTKLVLVPGGTVPSRGASLARSLDQLVASTAVPDLAPLATRSAPGAAGPEVAVQGIVTRGAFSGRDAMAHLVASWSVAPSADGAPPLMVAYGPPEVEELNSSARHALQGQGRLGATGEAELELGGHRFATGDQVLALRRIGPVRGSAQGTVVVIEARSLTVEWRGATGPRRSVIGHDQGGSLGYGYATTAPYLRSSDAERQSLLVLGDPHELAGRSARVQGAWVTLAGPGMPVRGPSATASRHRAGLVELATGWPDEAMLERAGPRPLAPGKRRRWAEVVAGCALERDLGLGAVLAPAPPLEHPRAIGRSPRL